jgi:hypothetical protein
MTLDPEPEPAEVERHTRELKRLRDRLQAELGPGWPIHIHPK